MNTRCLAAALAVAPLLASAADAADPTVPVPRLEYRSVLPASPTDLADPAVPWSQANQDVARFPRGHADLLKWEENQAAPPRPAASTPATPAAPRRHGHGDH